MPARDIFHNTVRIALEKDGWIITNDPLFISVDDIEFYIDLGAERFLAAEKGGQKIAVEVKSFLGPSNISEFYVALGQSLTYRSALKKEQPDRILYLAISRGIYEDFFTNPFIQDMVREYQLKLAIIDEIKEEVLLWKE